MKINNGRMGGKQGGGGGVHKWSCMPMEKEKGREKRKEEGRELTE